MANTWAGMLHTNIAREGISTLEQVLIPMQGFSMDLSSNLSRQGKVVDTRIVPAATAPTDLVDDESGSYASVVDDQTTTTVQVTLDPHPVTGFALTDTEAQEIDAGVWSDTSMRMVRSHSRAIGNAVLNSLFALVTNANYGAAAFTGAASAFDADDVADLRKTAVNAGWDMSERPVLVLNPDYYAALLKDNAIQDASASGSNAALTLGDLPTLSGFTVIESPTLPDNSENLVGYISRPDAMAIAMRGVETQANNDFQHYEVTQNSPTGAVLTYSAIFNRTYRRIDHVFEALYGVKKAQGASLKRIVSA
jgi:hypothetical protein